MWPYVLRRLASGILILVGVSVLVFLMFYVFPTGDPAALRAGPLSSPEQVEEIRRSMGLDQPWHVQYGIFMRDLFLHFDPGYSYQYGIPVMDLVKERILVTFALVAGAALVWVGIGVPAGVRGAVKPGSIFDRLAGAGSLVMLSAPVFWLGYVALILFAAGAGTLLPILPGIGAYIDAETLPERAAALILPCLVLGFSTAAVYFRLTRTIVSEQLSSMYVTATRARGVPERRVLWGHAVRSGAGPLLAMFGIDLSLALIGNVILIEMVFNVPGVGSLLTQSIERSDLPLTQGILVISAIFVVLVNLAIDLIYARLDPRARS